MQKRELTLEQIAELENLAKNTSNKTVYRRVQCVLLRAKEGWNRQQIAQATGYYWRHVERIQQQYFQQGLMAFERKPRVKAGRQYLSTVEEASFLESLESEAQAGLITSAKVVRQRLMARLEHSVSLSAVYGLLHRQGWSLKRPRPKHPQADPEAQGLFKKTCRGAE